MTRSYDAIFVILSVIVAMLASFAALDLAGRVRSESGATRFGWLVGGGTVMGLGIWSMHFVGMLAFHLPVPIEYDVPLMLLSVVVAIAASLLALIVINRPRLGLSTLVAGGVLMGVAIAGMHYIGMASVRVDARLTYTTSIVALSVLIAIVASLAALWLAFRFRSDTTAKGMLLKVLSAVIMGIAISGMHYTAMAAARFAPGRPFSRSVHHILASGELGGAVVVSAILIIALALIGTVIDRNVQARAAFTRQLAKQNEILSQQAMEMELAHEALQKSSSELEMQADELQRANRELAQSQAEAEKANRAKMEFLTVMSHELRTPLNAINGYTELMEMEIGGMVSEAQREYLARIKKSGKFLLGLINDVLNFAKINAGSVNIKREPVRLDTILETSHMLVEPQMKARNIAYRCVAIDATCMAVGDSEKIEQVILNLLTNALKFTDPGGAVTLSCESNDGRARIKVADTGRGIPAARLESVFDPFVQLDRSADPGSQHGVGLGLAISRELARAMGGELTAESEVGKGSVFTLALELPPAP